MKTPPDNYKTTTNSFKIEPMAMDRESVLNRAYDKVRMLGCVRDDVCDLLCSKGPCACAELYAKAALTASGLLDRIADLEASLDAVKAHAIAQDCGRLCDSNPTLVYREQWKRSEAFVDGLIRQALSSQPQPRKTPV